MLAQKTSAGTAMESDVDELLRDTQITSVTVKEASTVANRVASKGMDNTSLSATANLVCKKTSQDCTYYR